MYFKPPKEIKSEENKIFENITTQFLKNDEYHEPPNSQVNIKKPENN